MILLHCLVEKTSVDPYLFADFLFRLRFKLGTMHYEGDEVKLDKARASPG